MHSANILHEWNWNSYISKFNKMYDSSSILQLYLCFRNTAIELICVDVFFIFKVTFCHLFLLNLLIVLRICWPARCNPDHSSHPHCHCLSSSLSAPSSLLLFSTVNSKGPFSWNPSHHRPHPIHRTAFTDSGLLSGFLFSFSINLSLVRAVD